MGLLTKNTTPATLFMTMRMVHVWDMWLGVSHRLMFVKMRVRLARRICGSVRMTMVLIMHMRVGVGHGSMEVHMVIVLSDVQPDSYGH